MLLIVKFKPGSDLGIGFQQCPNKAPIVHLDRTPQRG